MRSAINKSLIVITVTLFIGSCGGGGGTSSVAVMPSLSLESSDTEKLVDESITLTWTSSNATSCSASGAWSGTKDSRGPEAKSS